MDPLVLCIVTQVWVLVDLVSGLEELYIPDARIQDQQRRVQEKNPCKLQNNKYCLKYSDVKLLIEKNCLQFEILVAFR